MLLKPSFSQRKPVPLAALVFLALIFLGLHRSSGSLNPLSYYYRHHATDQELFKQQVEFWRRLEYLFSSNPPGIDPVKKIKNTDAIGFSATTRMARPDLIAMTDDAVNIMKMSHASMVRNIQTHPPILPYRAGTRGLVATAGGSYLPLIVISLRMLRLTGSTLPMEVFLASNKEYESFICETTLPELNARCVILPEIMDVVKHSIEISKYQLKIFSMLFSSFEEILFLDSDAFPIRDPKDLFESEPYRSNGLVTWPDFWMVTESPRFFDITGREAPPTSLRASTEAGEIIVSKRTHSKTLLMAAFYNYYGPEYYYPLLSQGAPGEGDKETFTAAAEALNETYYQVSERVQAIGHMKEPGVLDGSAMVQSDPREDFSLTKQGIYRTIDPSLAPSPKPFFVHVNFPKFNPARIFDRTDLMRNPNGTYRRMWIDKPETMQQFNFDVEKRYWQEEKWVACNLDGKFRDWYGQSDICGKATTYYHDVFESEL
jgi:alpha 1,2-mannosyltransferase